MSMPFNRTAVIPVWIIVFGLLAVFWSPLTATTAVLLLIGAVVAPAVMLLEWTARSPSVAEVLSSSSPFSTRASGARVQGLVRSRVAGQRLPPGV